MGDQFFSPQPNPEPIVPPGNDTFDTPPPNFRLIGQMFASGVKDAGGLFGALGDLTNWVLKLVAAFVGAVLSLVLCIVAFLIGLINRMYEGSDPGVDAIARRSLEHVFQIGAGGSTPRRLAGATDTAGAANALGRSILDALTSGAKASGGSTLQPSSVATETFLGKLARIGIEGWTEGLITEALTLGQFKAVMELTPIMADILGLGRLSRRVLAPPLKILVEDPYTWLLNNTYRPTLLAHDQAVRQYLRGRLSRDGLDSQLGRQGYSAAAIEALINIDSKLLALGDVDYLVSRGYWSRDQAVQTLKDDGYSDAVANQTLQLAEQRRLDVYQMQLLDVQISAFERGELDDATMQTAISSAPLTEGEKNLVSALARLRRQLNVKHLTLAEVQTMIKQHVMTLDDLQQWMTRENYPPEEQTFLELLLLGQVTTADQAAAAKKAKADAAAAAAKAKAQAAAAAAAAAAAKLQQKGVSVATFEQLVMNGQRSFAEFTTFLQNNGLAAAAITDLVDLLHAKIQKQQDAAAAHAALVAESDTKHIPLAEQEKAVLAGVITIDDLARFMTANEYAPADIQVATAFVQSELDAAKAKADAKAAAAAKAQQKSISLPELERAARLGLTTVQAYSDALDAAGFDPTSRDLMVGLLNVQIANDQATLATRKAAAAKAAKKKISLPQLEQAVISGVRPIGDYQAELSALGFDATDQATLVELLQLRVDHAKDVAAKKAAADAKLKTRSLTLAQLERAVKLGVLSIDQYNAELAAAGFSAEDVTILSTSLLAEVAALKQVAARRATISKGLAKKGVSLAQEEQLVKSGVVTLDSYQGFLLAQGYSATDAGNLASLLSLQIDQAAAAAAAHALAQQKAADKEISLAKEEQAVIDGIRTMDDYAALLADLGFDPVDQATLVDLLSEKVAAARAKAAAAAPASPTPSPAPPTP